MPSAKQVFFCIALRCSRVCCYTTESPTTLFPHRLAARASYVSWWATCFTLLMLATRGESWRGGRTSFGACSQARRSQRCLDWIFVAYIASFVCYEKYWRLSQGPKIGYGPYLAKPAKCVGVWARGMPVARCIPLGSLRWRRKVMRRKSRAGGSIQFLLCFAAQRTVDKAGDVGE